MCSPSWRSFLRDLPKCEHHMHLEGALTPALLFQLAAKNKITLPTDDPAYASVAALQDRYTRFTSLDDFLAYYYIGMQALTTADDFEALAWDYFEHTAADGVAHAEVFFDPQAHLSRGVQYDAILEGVSRARTRAHSHLGISSELIACFLRHLPPADSVTTFELPAVQAGFASGAVIGIGLDSSETGQPPEKFAEVFAQAGAAGLRRTAHAGEEGPAEYVKGALDVLGATRIDHGRRAAEDPALLTRLAAGGDGGNGTLLTLCPLSNVALRGIPTIADLPIPVLMAAGVPFSINSDDPAYFGGCYVLDNCVAVQDAFALSREQWASICADGIRGSWCGEARKTELLARLQRVLETWTSSLLNLEA